MASRSFFAEKVILSADCVVYGYGQNLWELRRGRKKKIKEEEALGPLLSVSHPVFT